MLKNSLYKIFLGLIALSLAACHTMQVNDSGPKQYVDVTKIPNAVPKVEQKSVYGNAPTYVVNGRTYHVLASAKNYDKKGIASWYGTKFHGHLTSDREIYDMFSMTAASTELPLPTYAQVTNLENGRQIIVKVNDRGPFDKDRILDLSYAGANKLGYANKGTALVEVKAIDPTTWRQQNPLVPIPEAQPVKEIPISKQPQIYLQIGAFAKENNAEQLQQKIIHLTNRNVIIKETKLNNRPIYEVQIGPLTNVNENDQLQQILAENNLGRAYTKIY